MTEVLQCPQCNNTFWQRLELFEIQAGRPLDNLFQPIDKGNCINKQFILVCAHCGYQATDAHELTKYIPELTVVVTGNSHGYKRRALKAYGLDPQEIGEWDDLKWIREKDLVFITKQLYETEKNNLGELYPGYKIIVQNLTNKKG